MRRRPSTHMARGTTLWWTVGTPRREGSATSRGVTTTPRKTFPRWTYRKRCALDKHGCFRGDSGACLPERAALQCAPKRAHNSRFSLSPFTAFPSCVVAPPLSVYLSVCLCIGFSPQMAVPLSPRRGSLVLPLFVARLLSLGFPPKIHIGFVLLLLFGI